MPHDMVARSMQMFGEQVMPIVRAELDQYLDELYPERTQSEMATGLGAR
jgi:hypothetical protein